MLPLACIKPVMYLIWTPTLVFSSIIGIAVISVANHGTSVNVPAVKRPELRMRTEAWPAIGDSTQSMIRVN